MIRLSASSLAGTARTLVAVGISSEACMLVTTLAGAPRSTVTWASADAVGATAGLVQAGVAAGWAAAWRPAWARAGWWLAGWGCAFAAGLGVPVDPVAAGLRPSAARCSLAGRGRSGRCRGARAVPASGPAWSRPRLAWPRRAVGGRPDRGRPGQCRSCRCRSCRCRSAIDGRAGRGLPVRSAAPAWAAPRRPRLVLVRVVVGGAAGRGLPDRTGRAGRRPVVGEEVVPGRVHRRRIGQVALVHLLDQPLVRAEVGAG